MTKVLLLFVVVIILVFRKKNVQKPQALLRYDKNEFEKNFEFTCAYCGSTISTKYSKCPSCGSSYGETDEYLEKKQAMNYRYLNYLNAQEKRLDEEEEYIERTMEVLRKNKIYRNTVYNFDIGEKPDYIPRTNFEFSCNYCHTKLNGTSKDLHGCPNCGAKYTNNLELLVQEKDNEIEKRIFDDYLKLKEWEQNQNAKNAQKDEYLETKYAHQTAFLQKNGKIIAVILAFLLVLLAFWISNLLN